MKLDLALGQSFRDKRQASRRDKAGKVQNVDREASGLMLRQPGGVVRNTVAKIG
jgi:hypothetical protein